MFRSVFALLFLFTLAASSAPTELKYSKKFHPRKLNGSRPSRKNVTPDLGKIEAHPLGEMYVDSEVEMSGGSESDSDSDSFDSSNETEVDELSLKIKQDPYYSSTDDLYTLNQKHSYNERKEFYEK